MLNQSLEGLIARVSKATEGGYDLDREIAIALGWTAPGIGLAHWHDPDGNHWTALDDWSTSIDSALRLVEMVLPGAFYHIAKGRMTEAEPLFAAELLFGWDQSIGAGEGPTAPLAIILATLRALQHSKTGDAA